MKIQIFALMVLVLYLVWCLQPKDEVVTLEAELDTNGVWAVEFEAPDKPCRFLVRMADEQGNVIEYGPFAIPGKEENK